MNIKRIGYLVMCFFLGVAVAEVYFLPGHNYVLDVSIGIATLLAILL